MLPNPNFAQIVIVTKDIAARERVKARLEHAVGEGALPEARTRVDRFTFGPPVCRRLYVAERLERQPEQQQPAAVPLERHDAAGLRDRARPA